MRGVAMKRELVEVIWRDAVFDLDVQTGVTLMHTVGWVIEEDEDKILISSERGGAWDYNRSYTAIPLECVVDVRELTYKRKKK